jgi:hypothetical protein
MQGNDIRNHQKVEILLDLNNKFSGPADIIDQRLPRFHIY